MKLSFRHGGFIAAILLLAILTACGGNGNNQPDSAEPLSSPTSSSDSSATQEPAASEPAESEEAETREFQHGKGVSVIPVRPQRIVAIQYTGAMLALGVKPVGGDNEWSAYPLLENEWEGIEPIGDPWNGLNLEKIVELEPDLIVTHVEATYDELSKIAPTLWIPWLQYNPQEQIALFGDILGKQAEAETWLKEFNEKLEQTKKDVSSIIGEDETVSIFNVRPQNQFIYGNKAMGGYVIYDLLGLKAPDIIQRDVLDQGLGQLEISLEVLPEYVVSDYVFLSILANDGGAERADEIVNGPIFSQLPAAKNGKVISLDWNTYFTTDPLSTRKQLDAFAELLKTSVQQ
ncbi:ABC transporter substrate-binding protein [Paenibacillus sp. CAU 1782]